MLTKVCFVLFVRVCVPKKREKMKMRNYVEAINTPVPFFFLVGLGSGVLLDTAYCVWNKDELDDDDECDERKR